MKTYQPRFTPGTYLSTPCRDTRSVFGPKLLSFPLKADQASFQVPFRRTFMHKGGHNSGLQRTTRKIETCGPAPNVVELEQDLYTASRALKCVKTDVRILCKYSCLLPHGFVWRLNFARAQSPNGLP